MARARRMHERASTINGNLITGKRKISMSSKPKRIEITEPQATFTQSGTEEVSVGNSARDEEIRRRAYEIYLERGHSRARRRASKGIRDIRGYRTKGGSWISGCSFGF